MEEKQALELITDIMRRWRERKPTTAFVLIGAVAWIATVAMIGKAALVLAIPAFLIFFISEMKEV